MMRYSSDAEGEPCEQQDQELQSRHFGTGEGRGQADAQQMEIYVSQLATEGHPSWVLSSSPEAIHCPRIDLFPTCPGREKAIWIHSGEPDSFGKNPDTGRA